MAHQLRTQYTLAYYPKSNSAGFRHIEVKVAQSGTRVRTRSGFGRAEHTLAEGSPEQSTGCEHEQLRPYPYESKITLKNGCTVYYEDFQNEASGWPSKERYHYVAGTYQIVSTKHLAMEYTYSLAPGHFPIGDIGSADPAEGVLVANGPWFGDLNASVSVELKSTGVAADLAAAAGLVFRLNDRGY